jgi:hypothetical protein
VGSDFPEDLKKRVVNTAEDPTHALARRLRALREEAWPGVRVTQLGLARALGVSVPSISSWESLDNPKPPPWHRLRAYATFFATPRSTENRQFRLIDPDDMDDAERARRVALERELFDLRAAVAGHPGPDRHTRIPVARSAPEQGTPALGTPQQAGFLTRSDLHALLRDTLLDQRSLMQHALETMDDYLRTPTPEAQATSARLVLLLKSAPWLVASTVLTDNELSHLEADADWSIVWTVSDNDSIEFEYPAVGPSYAPIVLGNLARGVRYRYLVPESRRALDRARVLVSEHANLEVRFLDDDYWRNFASTVDELVVYESSDPAELPHQAYYLYPGSEPRRWIAADRTGSQYRLHDVHQAWSLAKERIG